MTNQITFKHLLILIALSLFAAFSVRAQSENDKEFGRLFKSQNIKVNNVKIHYLTGGRGTPLVLLHGFPETSHAWRKVMPALAKKFTLIVPDLRGMGDSEKPASGYDKKTLGEDVFQLMQQLGYQTFYLVGHDFGGSTAYSLAAAHPQTVRRLVAIECLPAALLPDESAKELYARAFGGKAWFSSFNQTKELPEKLVAGREDIYLSWLFDNFAVNKAAITASDRAVYFRAYAAQGAMHAAFEFYRAGQIDAANNREFAKTKLTMPILAVGADGSFKDATFLAMQAAGNDVRGEIIKDCGHFVPEEQPQQLTRLILDFLAEGK